MSDYKQFTEKYRPKKFKDVVGQKVAVGTLESMILKGTVNPTIMLSGPYGTGKTTLGRMIARYVNCATKDACGTCKSCLAMDSGTHTDVVEINAANARGIDDVRALIASADFTPRSNYRVFILDEAQQFSPQAAQALLKPLEEPPKRTLWIICTTDPQKILPAIRSRAQQIKLQAVPVKSLVNLMSRICEEEKLVFPEKALEVLATMADGHPRNALMLLEQVQHYLTSNGGMPENLEEALPKIVEEIGSLPPELLVSKYIHSLLDANYRSCCNMVRKAENPEYFLHLSFKYIRNLLHEMAGVSSTPELASFLSQTAFKRSFTQEHLVKLLELHLSGLEQAKRYSVDSSDVLDLIVLKSLEIMLTAPMRA